MPKSALPGLLVIAALLVWETGVATQTDRRLTRPVTPGRRLALVVGNNAYPTARLTNAVNDAQAVARTLRDSAFDVTEITDTTLRTFERAVDGFAQRLRADDLAVFYFAGHGLQIEGENYLLPIDYDAVDIADVKYEAYSASRVHDKLAAARVKVLILDACRDNPFVGTRSASRGLATMSAQGSLIAFATGPGQTASDNRQGSNGLFTEQLLKALATPGLTLSDLFRNVRVAVHEATGGRQSPWVFDNLIGDVTLREGTGTVAPPPAAATIDAAALALQAELSVWDAIKDSRDPKVFEDYLAQNPNGRFRPAARERINALSAAAAPPAAAGPAAAPPPAAPFPAAVAPSIVNGRGGSERSLLGYDPSRNTYGVGGSGKDVVYVATPPVLVYEALRLANVKSNDTVYDLGSGDGRVPIMAAKHFGARGVGIEFTQQLNTFAAHAAREAGVADRVTFRTEDLFDTDLRPASVIFMFLLPTINERLRPALERLTPGTRIVTNTFQIEGWQPVRSVTVDNCSTWCTAHLYTVPRR